MELSDPSGAAADVGLDAMSWDWEDVAGGRL